MNYHNILFLCLFLVPCTITEKMIASNNTYTQYLYKAYVTETIKKISHKACNHVEQKWQKEQQEQEIERLKDHAYTQQKNKDAKLKQEIKTIARLKKNEEYKEYFVQQEKIYQELLNAKISGVRPLHVDAILAEAVLENGPKEINKILSSIEQKIFIENTKNIILRGIFGTGKSTLAQAIAIKSQAPCLFFNVRSMLIEPMKSVVQNLNKIFEYAHKLEKTTGKPCVIIFDDLEALTKNVAGANNFENNNLLNFWQELDKFNNTNQVVIGTMNKIENLPIDITTATSIIKIPLPKLALKKAIFSYYVKETQDKYKLIYPEWFNADNHILVWKLRGFSPRDIKNLVSQVSSDAILAPAASGESHKKVMDESFASAVKFSHIVQQIKKDPQWKLEREKGTWKHTFKKGLHDPKTLTVSGLAMALYFGYQSLVNQERGFDIGERGLTNQEKGLDMQREGLTNQEKGLGMQREGLTNQERAMSCTHIAKQAAINTVFNLVPTVILKSCGLL